MERFTRIKPGELGLKPARVVKAEEFATAHDAQAIIAEARRAADRIVAEAKEVFERERARGLEEGREAANPFWPDAVPVDAYCALIVDTIDVS